MKKITSLTLGFSFVIMSYTGIMLFIAPKGKIAYWSDWHLLGLSKDQYGDLHTTSILVFLVFGFLHIYYNWRSIVSYLKDSTHKISFTKKELLIALAINLFFVLGTLYPVHPMKAFLQMEEKIKNNWEKRYGSPPYGHAEESKLSTFCKKMRIDLEDAKVKLTAKQIQFTPNDTIQDIAKNNGTSPNKIFEIIMPQGTNSKSDSQSYSKSDVQYNAQYSSQYNSQTHAQEPNTPQRLGRKTLQELSDMQAIDLQHALTILQAKGLQDVSADAKVKNIADDLGIMPVDVYKMIKK
jgi:hypothetical protein